jgi:ketosteroid isomerase-like protein
MSDAKAEVGAAAAALVAAFGAHDVDGYFGAFAPEATFLFHTTPRLLESRAAYEAEWRSWETDGFRVQACRSLEPEVRLLTADVAVFTHRVRTRVRDAEGEHDLAERETIVFRRESLGRWLGVHEHLSAEP